VDINYFPGRLRLRDKILKIDDIREAALKVVNKFPALKNVSYKEKTGSILIEYDPDALPMEKIKSLEPIARKLQPKILLYSDRNKAFIIEGIEQIGQIVDSWML